MANRVIFWHHFRNPYWLKICKLSFPAFLFSISFPCIFIYFLKVYLPQSTMYLPSQKLTSHTWKQFETTPKKEKTTSSSSHQVIITKAAIFPRGFGPSFYSFQGQLVTNPHPPILGPGGWVVSQSPPGKYRQVYLIGAADRASNLPTECGVVYLRTDRWMDGWERYVMG